MNNALIETLKGLKRNPALAVILYKQLFMGRFWAIAQKSTDNLENIRFLTYPSANNVRELPVFIDPKRHLLTEMSSQLGDSMIIEVEGKSLWPRMLDIAKTGECEIAVDPGEEHGIRLTREMILGMVSTYAAIE
ncbi:MAG: hypothetical protein WCC22_19390 [Terriglobales bacterium]